MAKDEVDYKPKGLLEQIYGPCPCGALPDWYCNIWVGLKDKASSRCIKEIKEEGGS